MYVVINSLKITDDGTYLKNYIDSEHYTVADFDQYLFVRSGLQSQHEQRVTSRLRAQQHPAAVQLQLCQQQHERLWQRGNAQPGRAQSTGLLERLLSKLSLRQ